MAVSLGGGTVLLLGDESEKIEGRTADRYQDDPPRRTQGLVQLRIINLDEDMDTQETSCYVHEGPRGISIIARRTFTQKSGKLQAYIKLETRYRFSTCISRIYLRVSYIVSFAIIMYLISNTNIVYVPFFIYIIYNVM